jgi:hypothetical protein
VSGNSNEPVYFIIPIVNCPTTSTSSTSTSSTSTSSTSTSSTSTSSTSTSSTSTSSTSTTSTTTTTTTPLPAANAITFQIYQPNDPNYIERISFGSNNDLSFLSWGDGYYQYGGVYNSYSYNYAGNILPKYFNGYMNPNGTNLTSIDFFGGYNYIDISKCNTITSFNINNYLLAGLFSIDFSLNTNLEIIKISANLISSLNFTNLNKLSYLDITDKSTITILNYDFSSNTSLQFLSILGSKATSFPILPSSKIKELILASFNNLSSKSFIASNNLSELTTLYLYYDFLNNVNIDICTKLTTLDLDTNNLTSLNISNQALLNKINVSYNNLTSLNLINQTLLNELDISNNNFSTVGTSSLINLKYFYCQENANLSSLNLSNNKELLYLLCYVTNLSTLDLSNNKKLTAFDASGSNLNSIILPNTNNLSGIYLLSNRLSSATVNYILANAIANVAGKQPGVILLDRQTPPAPPTGQGIIDKNKLIALGWIVVTD